MVDFKFPDVGEGLTEAKLVEWTVSEGDTIEEDDTVAHVETDKAVVDIPGPESGTVTSLKADEGDTIKVGSVIMTIQTGKENPETPEPEVEASEEPTETRVEQQPSPNHFTHSSSSSNDVLAMPAVRQKAQEKGIDLSTVTPTGNHGQILLEDLESGSQKHVEKQTESNTEQDNQDVSRQETVEETPEEVSEKPYKPRTIAFTGRPSERGETQEEPVVSEQQSTATKIPKKISSLRQNIARNMRSSLQETAQFTVTEQADVTHIVEQRKQIKQSKGNAPSLLAYFTKAVLIALKEHTQLNSTFKEDTLTQHEGVDLDVAVNTDNALYTPTIRRADTLDIVTLAEQIKDVADSVRNQDLQSIELGKGTFTVTSLGILGGEYFTPILDTPRVSILGFGQLRQKPWIHQDRVMKRDVLPLSLTVDHQVIDGADAAQYIKHVKHLLEHPEEILIQ